MTKKTIWKLGVVFLLALFLAVYMEAGGSELLEGCLIERNQTGEGEKELILELKAEGMEENYEYHLEVQEVLFTETEASRVLDNAITEIEEDFLEIAEKIPMRKTYQSGLVEATWKFDVSDCMDIEGNIIKEAISSEGQIVNAEVYLKCQNYEKVYCFAFVIPRQEIPVSEKLISNITTYIEEEMQKEGEAMVRLPSEIDGMTLTWREKKENLVIKILFLEIVVAVLLVLSQKEKRHEAEKKRRENLEMDYPEIVGQTSILLGSGMTILQAWNKITAQYLAKRQKRITEERPGFEEIVYITRRMQEGESEREALAVLRQRAPLVCYHRFIRILLSNQSKGCNGVGESLEKETAQAYEQRILTAKKKGEEASTKMLLPLMIMMILVMAIVIMPAMLEFMM